MATGGTLGRKARPRARRQARAPAKARDAGLRQQLGEARARQAATDRILKVIARSPSDVQPVFDAMVRSALRLIDGHSAVVTRMVGDMLHLGALTSTSKAGDAALRKTYPREASKSHFHWQAIQSRSPIFIVDTEKASGALALSKKMGRARGYRSVLVVPLLREGSAVGTISVTRREPGSFAEHQSGLLKTFADQAVIAIENVRRFTETKEALERQTATAEILKVMASSPSDVQPVFDKVAERAALLCDAPNVTVWLADGKELRTAATYWREPGAATWRGDAIPIRRKSVNGKAFLERRTVHIEDLTPLLDKEYPDSGSGRARRVGVRAIVAVPMIREGTAIGTVCLWRRDAVRFSDTQVALLETFAAQAVIAIENVRLFNETKEGLERQTATAEILKVIARSPSDVQPVFEAITQSAARLFAPSDASVHMIEGNQIMLRAYRGPHVALQDFSKVAKLYPLPADPEPGSIGRLIAGKRLGEVPDTEAPGIHPRVAKIARAGKFRSILSAPLVRGAQGIGSISLSHPEPNFKWGDKQRALLQTFADQAVIAIENVRLFMTLEARNKDLADTLEQQTASSEILGVISSSPSDLAPVFDAILDGATRLCDAHLGVLNLFDGEYMRTVAQRGGNPEFAKWVFEQGAYKPGSGMATMIAERRPVQFADAKESASYRAGDVNTIKFVDLGGVRTYLAVPLLKDDGVMGGISIYRPEVRPFTDKQVDLVKTFANQAVIAIENARLFNETKEALERQTATGEILKVISSSPTDIQPVLDAVAGNAAQICGASDAVVFRIEGDALRQVAHHGQIPNLARTLPVSRGSATGRCVLDRQAIHIHDLEAESEAEFPVAKTYQNPDPHRTILAVPLLRGGVSIGAIAIRRKEVRPFSEKQVELLKTFADQAVIAIENVRLFKELEARNRDVTDALEQQTATAEILRVISSSPTNVQPVFDAIASSAQQLFGGLYVAVDLVRGDQIDLASVRGQPEVVENVTNIFPLPLDRESMTGRTIIDRAVQNIPDLEALEVPESARSLGQRTGVRALLGAPMLREGAAIGAIMLFRENAGEFSAKQVSLLKTFADQAVIAIENVRLFNETKEALERQTATAEILKVISESPTNVQPVFDAIVNSAVRLFEPWNASIAMRDGDLINLRAAASPRVSRMDLREVAKHFPMPFDPKKIAVARVIAERRAVENLDTEAPEVSELSRKLARAAGYRSAVAVPLVRENEGIGAIVLTHPQPGLKLSERQLALVQTFADQAVIAIENVRLFNETKEALEQQTASSEILGVISSSPTDLGPVFDAILDGATRLCDAHLGVLDLYDGENNRTVAQRGGNPEFAKWVFERGSFKPPSGTARMIAERRPFHIADLKESPAFRDGNVNSVNFVELGGVRSYLAVPLVKEDRVLGSIVIYRPDVRPFTDKQIELVKTFANQAVIAIENVRLFNETKEALERQTATAEILNVISGSPTDVQPVFDAIVTSAVRLLPSTTNTLFFRDGDWLRLGAKAGPLDVDGLRETLNGMYPVPFDPKTSPAAAAMQEGRVVEIPDTEAPGVPPRTVQLGRLFGFRSNTQIPLLRDGKGVGSLTVVHPQAGFRLSEKQLALMRTFADQAVIAIENVRMFKELQSQTDALTKSVGQLTALGEVGQAISSTLDLETVLQTIVARAVQLTGLDGGAIYEYDERAEEFRLRAAESLDEETVAILRSNPIRKGDGAVGNTAVTREPIQIPETQDESYRSPLREMVIRTGRRALLAVPLVREDHVIGALAVQRNMPGAFAPEVVELLKTFATQSAMAIQNARLFREIAEKGKQLETASQHKSQFLASMSHELRTPLNAILGFNEMMLDGLYGELPAELKDPLDETQKSGKHLLRLINNVLDLAKIEAGRMELSLSDYSVQDTVESVRSTLRPLAEAKGLELAVNIAPDLPLAHGDSGRITQCLMNLAGNSVKFTRQGKVEISVAQQDGLLRYSVSDTGIGIPSDKIASLFTEFKQTDATIAREYGGTGLGLSITKKFIEMHGGRIWVESEVGKGSAFIFEIPVRAGR